MSKRCEKAMIIITPVDGANVKIDFEFEPHTSDEITDEQFATDPVLKTIGIFTEALRAQGAVTGKDGEAITDESKVVV